MSAKYSNINKFKLVEITYTRPDNESVINEVSTPNWIVSPDIVKLIKKHKVNDRTIGELNSDALLGFTLSYGYISACMTCIVDNDSQDGVYKMCEIKVSIPDYFIHHRFDNEERWRILLTSIFSQVPNEVIRVEEKKHIPVPSKRTKQPKRRYTYKSKR